MKKNRYNNYSNRNNPGYGNASQNRPNSGNSRKATLSNAGIDADQYLSMRIDKEFIPDGAEVVIQVRDKETGELRRVPFNQAMDGCFGKNSQFYKQEMSDGHIFNPYIHRRWLPAQFRRNIREAGYNGIHDYVKRCYNWNYVTRFLQQECWKLAMLQRRDPEAFRERSAFFTLNDMQRILVQYADVIIAELDNVVADYQRYKGSQNRRYNQNVVLYPRGIGAIQREHVRPMRYRYEKFKVDVLNCCSYRSLSELIQSFKFDKADRSIPSSDLFAKCFVESGAYYTLKQMIMFEGLSLDGRDVCENLDNLKKRSQFGYMSLYRSLRV